MYMGVLATEYRLLKNAGQPTDTTIQELYYALRAFNRLDEEAESYFQPPLAIHPPSPADINGFFIRDDVESFFFYDHPTLAAGVTSNHPVWNVDSDWNAFENPSGDGSKLINEESHDQVWHLFMGLALITECLDGYETYNGLPLNDLTFNYHIRQEAIDIMNRIINYIRSNNWEIKNPVSGLNVSRGDDVKPFSYGAAEAACFIHDGDINQDFSFPQYPVNTCKMYHDAISYADAIQWNELGKPPGAFYSFSDEDYKPQVLAAVGSSWYTSMYPNVSITSVLVAVFDFGTLFSDPFTYFTNVITSTTIFPQNATEYELGLRAPFRDWQHMPLLHQVLHGGTNPIATYKYYDILDSSPCEGPYNFGYPDNSASFEWSTDNRMLSPDRRGDYTATVAGHTVGDDKVAPFYGEYNGLDYMIYHNLFALSHGISLPFYDYMDREVGAPLPPPGYSSGRIIIEGFNTIDANSVINSPAEVDFRAGTEIHLGPGFNAAFGTDFHAYIDPFSCSSDGHYRMASNTNDSTGNNMNTAVAYAGPTTFVKYPPAKNNNQNTENTVAPNAYSNSYIAPATVSNNPTMTVAAKDPGIRIQPNPNNGIFEVIITDTDKVDAKLSVLTIFGNVLQEQQINASTTRIDLSGQPKGVYYIKVENKQSVKVQKVIYQ